MSDTIKPGDWVRFYQAGELVVGIVSYVRRGERWPHLTEILTDRGCVVHDAVLEVRRGREA